MRKGKDKERPAPLPTPPVREERPVPLQAKIATELQEAIAPILAKYPDVVRSLVIGIDWLAQVQGPNIPNGLLMTHHGPVAYPDEVAGAMQAILHMWGFTFTRLQEVTNLSVQELSKISQALAETLEANGGRGDAATTGPG